MFLMCLKMHLQGNGRENTTTFILSNDKSDCTGSLWHTGSMYVICSVLIDYVMCGEMKTEMQVPILLDILLSEGRS